MSQPLPASRRPLSPFMLGPYYRFQLTSVLSFAHRLTGIALTAGAFVLAAWLLAVAAGPDAHATFAACFDGWFGRVVLVGFGFSLVYHLLNGVRHLLWDVGWGLQVPRAYATGWTVVALSVVATAWLGWRAFGGAP